MNMDDQTASAVGAVEALIDEKFRTEPFHNLHLLWNAQTAAQLPGGTCSDKTLSFMGAARRAGFDVALHSGFIGGREIHRLARVQVEGSCFFADVGNGWPALRLYPADREVTFRCFGMTYRTELHGRRLRVFHERKGHESLQLEIEVRGRPEADIRTEIGRRFDVGIVYPFSDSLRFSLVVGSRFLFLRGERLEIYSEDSVEEIAGISRADVPGVLLEHFGFELNAG
jgi:hypothetical protein